VLLRVRAGLCDSIKKIPYPEEAAPAAVSKAAVRGEIATLIINAWKSAGRQRGTAKLRKRSEGSAVTCAEAYAKLGLPRVVFGEHNRRNK
jgi:hypothetical protein